jgi:hypothetical protein
MFTVQAINTLWVEIATLYVLTAIAVTYWFELHWLAAFGLSPMFVGLILLTLLVCVQVLWVLVVGIDRLGAAIGIRKSPLL